MNAALLLAAALCIAQAPAAPATPPAGEAADVIEGFRQGVAAYDIRLDGKNAPRLAMLEKPLLHWSNPARTSEDGAVFLWLQEGRPQAIGSVFTYKLQQVRTKHEFQSLATVPLTARFAGQIAWRSPEAGVTFRPVPVTFVPAGSARLRTIQLKNMARDFSASLHGEKETNELRLLAQPLYRYEETKPPRGNIVQRATDAAARTVTGDDGGRVSETLLDGAIFSFALGTDPEALLLLEARPAEGIPGGWQWEYAFARFHYDGIIARRAGQEVWRAERDPTQMSTRRGDPASRDKTYVTFHVD